jgi:DNA-binding IclR family transcriptional regulator
VALAPCTAQALARGLATPKETVRRRLVVLRDRGHARRTPTGWVAVDLPGQADYAADVRRLFQRLHDLAAAEVAAG